MLVEHHPILGDRRSFEARHSASSLLVWSLVVIALLVQQSAFIEMPALVGTTDVNSPQDANVYNTVSVVVSFLIIGGLWFSDAHRFAPLLFANILSLAYVALVLMSSIWSIHFDLTIRRGGGYVLSMAIASYVAARFSGVERMKLISASFAVSAIGSFVYVTAFPADGIMQIPTLEGTWRGVFTHKNVLGPVMAVAAFAELYVLTATGGRPRWRFALLAMYLVLVALSRSATAILLSSTYLCAAVIYLMSKRNLLLAYSFSLIVLLVFGLVVLVLWAAPEIALGALGKDTSLTGRTELWEGVRRLIEERPMLGYGYRSMWSPGDSYRILMDELTGGWGVTSSHNAFLEIALQLGIVGIGLILIIVVDAFWRSLKCCFGGESLLGWFSAVYFATVLLAGQTVETLGLNQNVFWLMFSILYFSCGAAQKRSSKPRLLKAAISRVPDPAVRRSR